MSFNISGPSGVSGDIIQNIEDASAGYEFSSGFELRTDGLAGTSLGTNVQYTQTMVDNSRWLRFGFTEAAQLANDVPYWTDPTPEDAAGVGLFGGSHMPPGVTSLFDFSANGVYNQAVETGDLQYTAAQGSLDYSQAQPGDFAEVRFDFNITPQVSNTTVEIALIWATRDADGNITFTFPLAAQPIFFGNGTVGRSFLNRVPMNAYFASNEDVRAQALPAIRADNPVLCQPLTFLNRLSR